MSNAAWKRTEKAVCDRLPVERVSNTALGKAKIDGEGAWLAVESKHRKTLPQWLKDAMAQAERNGSEGKLPIVVLHELRRWHNNDLVVMRLKDFEEWFCGEEGKA